VIFLQSAFLWFLGLATIPVILYLLFRRRRQEVDWGATYILRLALASARRQTLWKQLLVVALRTVLLALLVLAFARPFLRRGPNELGDDFPHGRGTLQRIILLDNSLSMGASRGLGTRLDVAREALAALLTTLQPGDSAQIVALCAPASGTDAEPVAQPAAVPMGRTAARALAADIAMRSTPLDPAGALRAAVEAFREGAASNRQLVILTDLSRSDYPRLDDYELFGRMLHDLQVRVAILNLGDRARLNLAIESLTAGSERLLAGQTTNVYASVINYSDVPSENGTVQFFVDGDAAGEQPCILAPGQRRSFRFSVALPPGEHRLEARLAADAYIPDNRVERFVQATTALRLLLVLPGGNKAEGFEQPDAFLERAVRDSPESSFRLLTERVPVSQLSAANLVDRDVVVICDAQGVPASVRGELAGFVRRGGGLLLAPGPNVTADAFNADFADWSPARLVAPLRGDFDPERYQKIQATELDLPLLREFATPLNGDLSQARIYNQWQVAPAEPPPAVVLRLDNGDPLLLCAPFGQGRVLLWTTGLGGTWTSLPVHQAYLPLVQRLFTYAGGFGRAARNVLPGEPLIAAVPEGVTAAFLTTPDARLLEVPVRAAGAQRFVRSEGQEQPGRYELRAAGDQVFARFSVAMPLAESDLRMLPEADLQRLGRILGAKFAQQPQELKTALWRDGDGREQAGWFLLAILGLILLDALATRYFFS
jgi:hypothetical protein